MHSPSLARLGSLERIAFSSEWLEECFMAKFCMQEELSKYVAIVLVQRAMPKLANEEGLMGFQGFPEIRAP